MSKLDPIAIFEGFNQQNIFKSSKRKGVIDEVDKQEKIIDIIPTPTKINMAQPQIVDIATVNIADENAEIQENEIKHNRNNRTVEIEEMLRNNMNILSNTFV